MEHHEWFFYIGYVLLPFGGNAYISIADFFKSALRNLCRNGGYDRVCCCYKGGTITYRTVIRVFQSYHLVQFSPIHMSAWIFDIRLEQNLCPNTQALTHEIWCVQVFLKLGVVTLSPQLSQCLLKNCGWPCCSRSSSRIDTVWWMVRTWYSKRLLSLTRLKKPQIFCTTLWQPRVCSFHAPQLFFRNDPSKQHTCISVV